MLYRQKWAHVDVIFQEKKLQGEYICQNIYSVFFLQFQRIGGLIYKVNAYERKLIDGFTTRRKNICGIQNHTAEEIDKFDY